MSELIIFGCGGHGRSVADVALHNNPNLTIRFVDVAARPGEQIFGFDVLPDLPSDLADDVDFFAALGPNEQRAEIAQKMGKLTTIIASTAHISRDAEIGPGTFIAHGAHIGPLAKIGANAIINTGAILDHEVVLGENGQISPNVAIGGRTRIGKNSFIGIGASIIDRLAICDDVVIGAGSVVISDITEPGTYVGVPARKVK